MPNAALVCYASFYTLALAPATAVAALALASRRLLDRHEHAAAPVENDSIATAIHSLGQVQGTGWRTLTEKVSIKG